MDRIILFLGRTVVAVTSCGGYIRSLGRSGEVEMGVRPWPCTTRCFRSSSRWWVGGCVASWLGGVGASFCAECPCGPSLMVQWWGWRRAGHSRAGGGLQCLLGVSRALFQCSFVAWNYRPLPVGGFTCVAGLVHEGGGGGVGVGGWGFVWWGGLPRTRCAFSDVGIGVFWHDRRGAGLSCCSRGSVVVVIGGAVP